MIRNLSGEEGVWTRRHPKQLFGDMETMAKEMMSQRPEVVERLRKVLGN